MFLNDNFVLIFTSIKQPPALSDHLLCFPCVAAEHRFDCTFTSKLCWTWQQWETCVLCVVEKYFDMNKKQCKDALDLYKKFLVRMDKVSEFLKVAEVWTHSSVFITLLWIGPRSFRLGIFAETWPNLGISH